MNDIQKAIEENTKAIHAINDALDSLADVIKLLNPMVLEYYQNKSNTAKDNIERMFH